MNEEVSVESTAVGAPMRTSGMAIASLVLGILGLTLLPVFAPVPAAVLGHVARGQIKRDPTLTGGGFALAGLVLGWIGIALVAFIFLVVILITAGGSTG